MELYDISLVLHIACNNPGEKLHINAEGCVYTITQIESIMFPDSPEVKKAVKKVNFGKTPEVSFNTEESIVITGHIAVEGLPKQKNGRALHLSPRSISSILVEMTQ